MPIAKKTSFLDGLLSSGLITEDQLIETFGDALPEAPNELATELIKANLLTPYQAKQILAGKYRGFIIGPYKILRPLGQGGMGTVFLAAHTALNRKVALKILSPQHAKDRLSLERFQREARAAASLDHPNIVKLFDISQGAGVHFLVMEYVEGKNLQAFLADTGPMHFAQAVQYIAQAAAGLQHAHDKGLIHRDIKPSNLMVGKDGAIKILDMGLTRSFTDSRDDLTGTLAAGQVAGTVDYISPEQAMNQPLDERSDLYSLGATFHALITGEPPFKGSTTQKLMQHQMKEPPSVTAKLRGRVPEALSEVIRKMMAKRLGDRYGSANDVIDALSPWLPATTTGNIVHDPLTTSQINQASKRGTSTRVEGNLNGDEVPLWKRPSVLVGVGVGLAVLLVGLMLSFLLGGGDGKQQPSLVQNPGTGLSNDPPRGGRVEPKQIPTAKPKSRAENPPAEGRLQPLSLADAATAHNTGPLFFGNENDKFVFDRPGVNRIGDVPFLLPDASDSGHNIIVLTKGNIAGTVEERRPLPKTARLKIDAPVERLHFLSGVSGWGWRPNEGYTTTPVGSVCVVARLRYQDGSTEDHHWKNGEHFADFFVWKSAKGVERIDVPSSSFAVEAKSSAQVRYLSIRPAQPEKVLESVEFIKGQEDDITSPVVVAVTAELGAPRYQAVSISEIATVCSNFMNISPKTKDSFILDTWGERTVEGVPFQLAAPDGEAKNILALYTPNGQGGVPLPKSARLPVNAAAGCLHFLSGVSLWGYPWNGTEEGMKGSPKGSLVVTVRLTYADGKTEDHEWKNGEEFVDFRGQNQVPNSKEAFLDKSGGIQLRYLALRPRLAEVIKHVDFIKGENDNTSPLIFAMTIERTGNSTTAVPVEKPRNAPPTVPVAKPRNETPAVLVGKPANPTAKGSPKKFIQLETSKVTTEIAALPTGGRWGTWTVDGVPFDLIDPKGGAQSNAIRVRGGSAGVAVPCFLGASAVHVVGYHEEGDSARPIQARVWFASGESEVITLSEQPPTDQPADRKVRHLVATWTRDSAVSKIELIAATAADQVVVLAVTVEV